MPGAFCLGKGGESGDSQINFLDIDLASHDMSDTILPNVLITILLFLFFISFFYFLISIPLIEYRSRIRRWSLLPGLILVRITGSPPRKTDPPDQLGKTHHTSIAPQGTLHD